MQPRFRLLFWGAAAACALYAQTPPAVRMEPKTVLRGQEVFVDLPNAPDAAPKTLKILLGDYSAADAAFANKAVRFTVPKRADAKNLFPLGVYPVSIWLDSRHFEAGDLLVAASLDGPPVVDRVSPDVAYLRTEDLNPFGGGKGDWVILGHGFAANSPGDIKLLINGTQQDVIWGDACDARAILDRSKIYGVVKNAQELVVCNVPVAEQGQLSLSIRQGTQTARAALTTATRWPRWLVPVLAGVVTLVVVLAVYSLLAFAKGAHLINKEEYRYRALLLDRQTNTYSLSIFQFLLWTVAGVFGYVYLALSRMFVQRLDIPDVPGTLPAIVGVGVGAVTAVAAQAISMVRPKGSGDETPSPADLVTSGGSVAPDRVQMFVWTIIGVLAFVAGVLKQNPASMQSLPTIPDTMMALMGLSSVGYLGAKFARKAGPNILELNVFPAAAKPAGAPAEIVAGADVSKPVASAGQALESVKAAAAGLSEGSAAVAVRAARDAVGALEAGIAAASDIQKTGPRSAGLTNLATLTNTARDAAMQAAGEFDALNGNPGVETARLSATIAQRVAVALENLSADAGAIVSQAQAETRQRLEDAQQAFRRVIELRGANLSAEGLFRVKVGNDEYELPSRMLVEKDNRRAPEILIREDSTGTANMARALRLTIAPGDLDPEDRKTYDAVFGAAHTEATFTILNPDGQKSSKTFALPAGAA